MIQQRGVHCNTPSAFVQRFTARRAAQYFRLSSADDACRHLYILNIRSSLGPTNQVKIHWGEMQNAPPLPWGLAQRTCCTSLVCKGKSQTHGPTAQRRWAMAPTKTARRWPPNPTTPPLPIEDTPQE